MSAFPRKNLIFLTGLAIGVIGLSIYAFVDAESLAFDRALSELSSARNVRRREMETARVNMLAAIASGDTEAQKGTAAVFILKLGRVRFQDDTVPVLNRLREMSRIGVPRLRERLLNINDPQWLFLFDSFRFLAQEDGSDYARAFPVFLDEVLTGSDWPLRIRAAVHWRNRDEKAIMRDLGLPTQKAVPHLIRMLAWPDVFDRISAAATLEFIINRPVRVVADDVPAWQAGAADRAVWQAEANRWRTFWKANSGRPRVALILESLDGATKTQRFVACRLFENIGGAEGREGLLKVFGDDDTEVKIRAAGALARLRHPSAVRILLDYAFEEKRLGAPVDVPVMEQLETLGPEAADEIIAEIHSRRAREKSLYRRSLAMVLRDMGTEKAAPLFHEMCASEDVQDQLVGLEALSNLDDRSDEALRRFVEAAHSGHPSLRLSAARGLARLDVLDQAVPILIELLQAPGDDHIIPLEALALLIEALPGGPKIEPATLPADPGAVRRIWEAYWQNNRRHILSMPSEKLPTKLKQ